MVAELQPRDVVAPISSAKHIRVLHVVENLNNQAVETWLMRVLRAASIDYPHVRWGFFCVLGKPGKLDDTARKLGAEVIHSRYEIADKIRFIRSLREVMKRGHYDILHCHHDVMSAAYLAASAGLPFRKRIVHVHNAALALPTKSVLKKTLTREPMRQLCLRYADQIVGVSLDALHSMVGSTLKTKRDSVIHCGMDTSVFEQKPMASAKLRAEIGLDEQSKIILFVGRMIKYKNPCFVVEVLKQFCRVDPNVVAVFVGVGDQEREVIKLAKEKQLEANVKVLGWRNDVPLLMSISHLLIFPSDEQPKEGLGLGVVEAQAAGLPVLMSRSVPEEAVVIPELVEILPLAAGVQAWADAANSILNRHHPAKEECLAKVEASSFSISHSASSLVSLYR